MPQHYFKFTSATDLPSVLNSPSDVAADESPETVSGGPPGDVREFGVHHGPDGAPRKQVMISGEGEGPSLQNSSIPGGIPADVDTDFKRIP